MYSEPISAVSKSYKKVLYALLITEILKNDYIEISGLFQKSLSRFTAEEEPWKSLLLN
jgi:hypothetical protein